MTPRPRPKLVVFDLDDVLVEYQRERRVDALARATVEDGHDALFIACSQLPTHAILDDLRRDLGRPVWSSIAATAEMARTLHGARA